MGSRTKDQLGNLEGVQHIHVDVKGDSFNLTGLHETLNGLVYCPGTIRIKPFQRLTLGDFLEDLKINYLGAVRDVLHSLDNSKVSSYRFP